MTVVSLQINCSTGAGAVQNVPGERNACNNPYTLEVKVLFALQDAGIALVNYESLPKPWLLPVNFI